MEEEEREEGASEEVVEEEEVVVVVVVEEGRRKVACPVRGGVTVSRRAPIPNISHFPRGYVEKYWPPNARTANPVSCSCSGANGRRSLDVS